MKKYPFLFIIFCLLLFSACGDFQDVTFSGIENVNIVSISQQGAEAAITAKIKNPNRAAFTIYKSDLDVVLNGMNAGKAHLAKNIKIKGRSEQLYTFTIKADFSSLSLADLPKLMGMAMSKNVNINLKGNLNVGKLFVKKKVPVDMTQRVPLGNN
jgi:LEA14-like dessication related protein